MRSNERGNSKRAEETHSQAALADLDARQAARVAVHGRRNQFGQAMGAKGMETRRRLLRATGMLLRSVPLRDLNVVQIAREARTSTATFYVYFNEVADAVLALTGEVSQSAPNLMGLMSEPWPPMAAPSIANEFIAAYLEQIEAHAPILRVRNLASDEGDARFSIQRLNAITPLVTLMAARILEVRVAGGLPQDLEPRSAAGTLLALVERIAVQWPRATHASIRARLVDFATFYAVLLFSPGSIRLDAGSRRPQPPAPDRAADKQVKAPLRRLKNQHGQSLGAKGQGTRSKILVAIESLAAERSLFDFKVADIVRAAKTSNATFYRYFEDVPEALLSLIAERSQSTPQLLGLLEADWTPSDSDARAHAFVQAYIEHWQGSRALFRIRNLAADEGDSRFYDARATAVRPLVDLLARRIAKVQADGRLPSNLHPRTVAEGFMAMIERLAVTPNVNTGDVQLATVARAAAYLLSVLVGGAGA